MLLKDLSDICKSGNAVSKTLASCFRLAECACSQLKSMPAFSPKFGSQACGPFVENS